MEMFATMIIIGVLVALLIVAVAGAVDAARGAADRQSLAGMKVAIGQFENEFGFLPPLINDGPPLDTSADAGPVNEDNEIVVRGEVFLTGRLTGTDGDGDPCGDGAGEDPDIISDNGADGYSDKRYSKVSLPYYLQGVSAATDGADPEPRPLDGVEGEGFRTPRRDGSFDPTGRRHGALMDMSEDRTAVSYFNENEFLEHGETPLNPIQRNRPNVVAYIDREGRAFRYYRWVNCDPSEPEEELGEHMNVPRLMLDPFEWDDSDASAASNSAEIAGARYALIGAGRDGAFGTEPRDVLIRSTDERSGAGGSLESLRAKAMDDNVVEVGR